MPRMVAVLLEETIEASYVAIELDGSEPEILFTKGPAFTKTMGPFPRTYAEATFRKWNYRKIINPPEVNVQDGALLRDMLLHLRIHDQTSARYED
jgi:hypothetical protein